VSDTISTEKAKGADTHRGKAPFELEGWAALNFKKIGRQGKENGNGNGNGAAELVVLEGDARLSGDIEEQMEIIGGQLVRPEGEAGDGNGVNGNGSSRSVERLIADNEFVLRPIEEEMLEIGEQIMHPELGEADEIRGEFWQYLKEDTPQAEAERKEQFDYISAMLPEYILRNMERLEDGQTRVWRESGTVAAFDLSGFTSAVERALATEDPTRPGSGSQKINEEIKEFFDRVHQEAVLTGGELISLGGDEVMYVFLGADHKERALHFASQTRAALIEHGHLAKGGVAAGDLLFGAVRLDKDRSMPVVLGAPVSEARAMESNTAEGQIGVHSSLQDVIEQGSGRFEKSGDGFTLDHYENRPKVENYLVDRAKARESERPASTFRNIVLASRFLHPHQSYVERHEGLRPNLYDGEKIMATVTFVDADFGDMYRALEYEIKTMATVETSQALAQFEETLRMINAMVREDSRSNLEKLVVMAGPSKLMLVGIKQDHEAHALKGAKKIVEVLNRSGIPAKAGVATGSGFRGMTGPSNGGPRELGRISDDTNRGAREASRAQIGQVLSDLATIRQARTTWRVEAGKEISPKELGMKNVSLDQKVVEVGRIEPLESTLEHLEAVRPVGRDKQQAQEQAAFKRVVKTGKQVVEIIVADAGEGKTLLTDWMIRERYDAKKDAEAEVIKARAYDDGGEKMYAMWEAPARKLFGVEASDGIAEIQTKVSAKLAEVGLEYIQYANLFIEKFGLAKIGDVDGDFPGFGNKVAEVFTVLLKQLAQDKPLVIVAEDLHWADHRSRTLLKALLAATRDEQMLFHLVTRPKENVDVKTSRAELKAWYRLGQGPEVVDIELGPLNKEDWAEFLATHFSIAGMSDFIAWERSGKGHLSPSEADLKKKNQALIELTYHLAEGNPHLGRLVMMYLLNYQDIRPDRVNPKTGRPYQFFEESRGTYLYRDSIDADLVKEATDLGGTYVRVANSLKSGEERVALKVAAKLGRSFSDTALAELLNVTPQTASRYLAHWEKLGWMEKGTELYSFVHASVQEAIDKTTAEVLIVHADGTKERLTNEALAAMVAEYKEDHGGSEDDLARLWGASNNIEKGMHFNIKKGDSAFARQNDADYQIAINAYNRAISMFESRFVTKPSNNGNGKLNGHVRAGLESLSDDARNHVVEDMLEAYGKLVKVSALRGLDENEDQSFLGVIDIALERLEQFGEVLSADERWLAKAELEILKAGQMYRTNRLKESAEIVLGYATMDEEMMRGLTIEDGRVVGDSRRRILVANYYKVIGLLKNGGELVESKDGLREIDYYDAALSFIRPDGESEEFVAWDSVLGNKIKCLDRANAWDEADELTNVLLLQEEARDYKAGVLATKIDLAERLLSRGTVEEAEKIREQLYGLLESVRDHVPRKELTLYKALLNLEETLHRYGEAKKLVEQFLPIMGAKLGEVSESQRINRWKAELAWLLAREGDVENATKVLNEIVLANDAAIGRETRGVLPRIEGTLAMVQGDYDAAERLLEESLAIFNKRPNNSNTGLVLTDLANLEIQEGRFAKALGRLKEALLVYGEDEPIERRYIEELIEKIS
jgi:tetratricopeptide (TPR) repeat protein/class 3 adenylate cyclase